MNFEDTQHFKILKQLECSNGKEIPHKEAEKKFKDCFGNSWDNVFYRMIELNLIKDVTRRNKNGDNDFTTFVTSNGIAKLSLLKKQKCDKTIRSIAFWILFSASLISAVYAVISYHFSGKTKSQSESKSKIIPPQKELVHPQSKITDSIRGYETILDSVTNGRNDSQLKDTAVY